MPIELHAADPGQVSSAQLLRATVDVGEAMLVLSGIAIPARAITDDEHSYPADVIVHLGVEAPRLIAATASVGLASIHADDTAFTMALNTATVTVDDRTGELQLNVATDLLGDPAQLNRFGYQVVALVATADSWVRGVVRWQPGWWGVPLPGGDPTALDMLLRVELARVEQTPDPPFQPKSSYVVLSQARLGSPGMDGDWAVVPFEIPSPPYGPLLGVRVTPSPVFAQGDVRQTSGPDTFTLSAKNPDLDGLIFEITPPAQPQ